MNCPGPSRSGRGPVAARQAALAAWLFLLPLLAYLVIFYIYPLYKNVDLSIRDYSVYTFVHGGARLIGLGNYRHVLQDPTFVPALTHTLVFTFVSVAVQFTLGLALALFFQQHFPLSPLLRALFLVPWLLPLIVSASTWGWMLNSDSGVVNSLLKALGGSQINWLTSPTWSFISVLIANIWIGIPFNLVVLYSGLQNISEDVLEAAALDGAPGGNGSGG